MILALAAFFPSCINDRFADRKPQEAGEQEVEITLLGEVATRAETEGTPEERIVETLDLLVFDAGGFKLWRSAYKVNDNFRVTLPICDNIDVYFIANCRAFVTALYDANGMTTGSTWEAIRLKLVDTGGDRFVTADEADPFVRLPMWGRLLDQNVEDVPINKWASIYLLRAVASVDVYVDPAVGNFTMNDLYLYFTPDRGFFAPVAANYNEAAKKVYKAQSPAGMQTTKTLYSDQYDATGKAIANKLYLYDNDTNSTNRTLLPDKTRRHTRLVVGGEYESKTYYYPIDFAAPTGDSLDMMTRNWKYVFTINSVSSRGYEDPDTASTEPMVGIDVNVVNWNVDDESDFYVSGSYYLGLERRVAYLTRKVGSTDLVPVRSNLLSDVIKLEFDAGSANGTTVTTAEGDISNDRFKVEKIKDASGYITGLKVTAKGAYDAVTASKNTDKVILTSGRIRVEITIVQQAGDTVDWEWGGDIGGEEGVDLEK